MCAVCLAMILQNKAKQRYFVGAQQRAVCVLSMRMTTTLNMMTSWHGSDFRIIGSSWRPVLYPHKRSMVCVFVAVDLNKLLEKQSICWYFWDASWVTYRVSMTHLQRYQSLSLPSSKNSSLWPQFIHEMDSTSGLLPCIVLAFQQMTQIQDQLIIFFDKDECRPYVIYNALIVIPLNSHLGVIIVL